MGLGLLDGCKHRRQEVCRNVTLCAAFHNGLYLQLSVLDYLVCFLFLLQQQVHSRMETEHIELNLLPALPDLTDTKPLMALD